MNNFELSVMESSDIDGVSECLSNAFCGILINGIEVSEPVITSLNIRHSELYQFLREYCETIVSQKLSVLMRNQSGKVVGTVVAEYLANERTEFKHLPFKFRAIMELVEYLDDKFRESNLFRKGRWAHGFMSASLVGSSSNNSNSANQLYYFWKKQMQLQGCVGVIGETTNPFSLHVAKRTGGKPLEGAFLSYKDFIIEGKKVFSNIEISDKCQLIYNIF